MVAKTAKDQAMPRGFDRVFVSKAAEFHAAGLPINATSRPFCKSRASNNAFPSDMATSRLPHVTRYPRR